MRAHVCVGGFNHWYPMINIQGVVLKVSNFFNSSKSFDPCLFYFFVVVIT